MLRLTAMRREFAPFTALLAFATIGAYGLELSNGGYSVCAEFGLVPARAALGTAFSSLFLHDPSGFSHIAGNVIFLVVFGGIVERAIGSARFLALYVAAGLGGCALHCIVNPSSTEPLVGASGALFGLLAVAAVVRPRLIGFAVAFAGLNILYAFTGGAGSVSFGCHIGGFAVGFAVVAFMRAMGSEALEAA